MKRPNLRLFWSVLTVLACAGPAWAQAPPKPPHIRRDVCPLECCSLGAWTARAPLQTYTTEGSFHSKAYLIHPGEAFTAVKGDLRTLQFGFVTVLRPVEKQKQKFDPGDVLYILSYQAYDYFLWRRGRTLATVDFWGASGAEGNGILYKQEPVMVWWVQVRNSQGQAAWLPLQLRFTADYVEVAEDIDNMNDCG
jgi:hypothetical protein